MDIELPCHEVTVNKRSDSETFNLEFNFRAPDGAAYSLDKHLNNLIDDRVKSRSDITESVVREAVNEMYNYIDENYDEGIDEVIAIDIVAQQKIRMTPYSERSWGQ